jgi:hypothetical protein
MTLGHSQSRRGRVVAATALALIGVGLVAALVTEYLRVSADPESSPLVFFLALGVPVAGPALAAGAGLWARPGSGSRLFATIVAAGYGLLAAVAAWMFSTGLGKGSFWMEPFLAATAIIVLAAAALVAMQWPGATTGARGQLAPPTELPQSSRRGEG